MAKRDTYNYDLKDGHRVVYRGTTNDPARRVEEHIADGKEFTHMKLTSGPRTRSHAREHEADALHRYRRGHGGRNPRYNYRDDG